MTQHGTRAVRRIVDLPTVATGRGVQSATSNKRFIYGVISYGG